MSERTRIRVGVILTGPLADAFNSELEKTLAQNAVLARVAIAEYLARRGYDVGDVPRGPMKRESKEGQPVGVGAR